jgi:hypothetical protein
LSLQGLCRIDSINPNKHIAFIKFCERNRGGFSITRAENLHVTNIFIHGSKRVDNRFAMFDQVKVCGTEEDFHGFPLFGGLKSCLSSWKPFGLDASPQDFHELSTGFSPRGAMRGFATFGQVIVGGTEEDFHGCLAFLIGSGSILQQKIYGDDRSCIAEW